MCLNLLFFHGGISPGTLSFGRGLCVLAGNISVQEIKKLV